MVLPLSSLPMLSLLLLLLLLLSWLVLGSELSTEVAMGLPHKSWTGFAGKNKDKIGMRMTLWCKRVVAHILGEEKYK